MPYTTGDWIKLAGGLGLAGLGTYLGSRAQSQQNDKLEDRTVQNDALAAEERKRRDYYASIAMPSLLQSVGNRDPGVLNTAQQNMRTSNPLPGTVPTAPAATQGPASFAWSPTDGPSALGRTAGGAALGAKFGGPIGAGIGAAGGYFSSKIGNGRNAANNFVQSVEDPFGAELAQIVRMKDSGDVAGAAARLQRTYQGYKAATMQAMNAGGNDATAARQSLANPKLQQTLQTIAQQLGVTL